MPHNLTQKYSSVVLNQNVAVSVNTDKASGLGAKYRQEFYLPSDYRRGTESGELRYPDLSGFQLMVEVEAGFAAQATFEYTVEYQVFGLGWVTVAAGIAIGAPVDGTCWMDAYFEAPVEIDQTKASARWRITFWGRAATDREVNTPVEYNDGVAVVYGNRVVADLIPNEPWPFLFGGEPAYLICDPSDRQVYFNYQQGLQSFWYSSPNPLALPNHVRGTNANFANSPITGSGGDVSFCFRVLSLTADDGVDFLGNQYRSVVSRNDADDMSTAEGADPDSYWLSKPNPSKFAIENLYFDVRRAGSTTHGKPNLIPNPRPAAQVSPWQTGIWGTSGTSTLSIVNDPTAPNGTALQVATPGGANFQGTETLLAGLTPGTYSVSLLAKSVSGANTVRVAFSGSGSIDTPTVAGGQLLSTTDWTEITALVTVTVTSLYFYVRFQGTTAGTFRIASVIVSPSTTPVAYFDGDTSGHVWSGSPHNSVSYELIEPSIDDVSSVIDRVLIDPITPGPYFSIYYSDEGEPGANEDAWESKLWTRVPQTYRMERRETHVLPEPVKAKYLKVEFSHLQAQHYAPGNFQQPIRYKKHPKWVLDYFLARLADDQANPFLAERVRVIYDALDLAYNYYLDDLGQEPQTTVDVNNTSRTQVVNFLSNRTDASDRIDAVTLDKINLVMNGFRQHPALRGSADSLLAKYARETVDYNVDYPIELNPPTALKLPDVSSLNRDSVVIEQDYPVMFFYLTSRHAYREVEAKFSHDRAYFVGVRELAFLRDNYMTAFDTSTYIESAADTANIERNEFI